MPGTTAFDNALLLGILNAQGVANLFDNTATSPATVVYVSLHTASPGKSGDQTTSETSYTGYARVSVARTAGGWTVSGASASNTAIISFGKDTAGTPTLTHFGIGLSSTGAGSLKLYGALNSSLVMAVGATPLFEIGQLQVTVD